MILSWRKRKASRKAEKKQINLDQISSVELRIPSHFRCPISLDLMKDPVTLSTGITYDRESIEKWINEGANHTCPMTNQVLSSLEPVPNHTLRMMIQDWCVEKRSYGIERIPTPKIPVSSADVLAILSKIEAAKDSREVERCKKYVLEIKALVNENERNKRCVMGNGGGGVLAAAFEAFSEVVLPFEQNVAIVVLLEEILSALALMLPLDHHDDGEARNRLGANSSLHCLIWCLKNGNLSSRRNSILALIEIVSNNREKIDELVEIEGATEALVKVIKEPISPSTTKATLLLMYHIVSRSLSSSSSSLSSSSANSKVISGFAKMGLVDILLEMLVDCEKSMCEKALGVLDELCSSDEGREKASDNALTVPVLVKKILRVSDMATQFSVSILWKLGKINERSDIMAQALELGAFQKLLLLLQVGCSDRTKEKASDVLKWLNLYRDKVECIDSLDFKNLRRPF